MVRRMTGLVALLALAVSLVVTTGCSTASTAAPAGGPSATTPGSGGPEGTAKMSGVVQAISVDLSQGFYDPTVIRAKSGLTLEISFGQGQGCLAKVLIPAFQVDQDLPSGGAVIRIPAMKAGESELPVGRSRGVGQTQVK